MQEFLSKVYYLNDETKNQDEFAPLNIINFNFAQNVTKKSLKSLNSGEMLNYRHRLHDRQSLFMDTEDNDSFSSYSNQFSSESVENQSCIV